MNVFAIILNYNNYIDTINVVTELKKQKRVDIKIIIVDNKSPNESYKKLHEKYLPDPSVTVLTSGENGGYSYGNNFGLRYIKQFSPEFVLVLNNDILIPNQFLIYNLIIELNKIDNSFLCSPAMLIDGIEKDTSWKVPTIWDDLKRATRIGITIFRDSIKYNFPKNKKTEYVECVPGSFFICNYKKFESLGFFDEDLFLFGEETILGYKIKQNNGINLLCRQYFFVHHWSKSINLKFNKIDRIKMQLHAREIFHQKYLHTDKLLIVILKFLHKIRIIEENFRLLLFESILKLKH